MTTHRNITCDTLDELLPAYLERELAAPDRAAVDGHIATCVRCSSLVADLAGITQAARALPELRPSRDLWDDIAAQIEAPVVPIAAGRGAGVVPAARRRQYLRFGAVAAGLMAMTAAATYLLTVRSMTRQSVEVAAAPGPDSPVTRPVVHDTAPAATRLASAASERDSSDVVSRPTAPSAPRGEGTVRTVAAARQPARQTLVAEIAQLQSVVAQRRTELDPKTIAVLEASLRVIDQAIAESRAALERDPASRFLNQQLTRTLDRKLELLRTAALLPAARSS
jgi:putative zinc finger protein